MKQSREKQLSLFNFMQRKEISEVSCSSLIPAQNFQDNPVAAHTVTNSESNSNERDNGKYVDKLRLDNFSKEYLLKF